jgi:hypothetical protein
VPGTAHDPAHGRVLLTPPDTVMTALLTAAPVDEFVSAIRSAIGSAQGTTTQATESRLHAQRIADVRTIRRRGPNDERPLIGSAG